MITQFDDKIRVVSLANLEAMCEHASGVMCHKFKVEKVTRSRVHVSYSNENEYAISYPITAIFPCYPFEDSDNPNIILDPIRIMNDRFGDSYQYFFNLFDCPVMWLNPRTNKWEASNA